MMTTGTEHESANRIVGREAGVFDYVTKSLDSRKLPALTRARDRRSDDISCPCSAQPSVA